MHSDIIPIEDAPTVAYVGIVHAISEIRETLGQISRVNGLRSDCNRHGIVDNLYQVIEDLTNAKETLAPHVRKSNE